MDSIARALIDRVILAQAEFDRELYTGFSRSRRENNKAELIDARDALLRYIDQLKSGE